MIFSVEELFRISSIGVAISYRRERDDAYVNKTKHEAFDPVDYTFFTHGLFRKFKTGS